MTPIARSRRGSRSAAAASPPRHVSRNRGFATLVEQGLVALGSAGPNLLALGRGVPVGGGGDGPGVGGEPDQHGVAGVSLRERAGRRSARPRSPISVRAGVADVRVVLPDDELRAPAVPLEVGDEAVQRVRHVAVAQVPRGRRGRRTSPGSTPRRWRRGARSARRRTARPRRRCRRGAGRRRPSRCSSTSCSTTPRRQDSPIAEAGGAPVLLASPPKCSKHA